MCRRFTVVTWDEVAEVVRELQADSPVNAQPDWPARTMVGEGAAAQVEPGEDVFPGAGVDVIVRGPESQLIVERLTWGFPVEWQQRPVYNTRLETAMGPNPGMWEQPIAQGRGIVATGGFFEAHATQMTRSPKTGRKIKQQYRFESGGGTPLLLATVCGQGCFSVVTTRPNPVVASVHDRMPLTLTLAEARWWLQASWPSLVANWQKLANREGFALTAVPEQPAIPVTFGQETLF